MKNNQTCQTYLEPDKLALTLRRCDTQVVSKRTKFRRKLIAVVLMGIGCAASVLAQNTEQLGNPNEERPKILVIEEITVTAQKRAQLLEDVPVAISALTFEFFKDANFVELEDLQSYVPSLMMERNANPFATTIRLRGVGNLGNIPNFEPAVGLFIDGAFRSRTGIGMGDLVDVERIEILHGPQSTLYGKNVTAGVVSIITKRPTKESEGMLEATFGENDEYGLKGFVSGPLAATVSGRLSVNVRNRDGLTYDVFQQADMNEVEQLSLRGQLLFEPSDRLSILAIAAYSDKGDHIKCCAPDTLYGPVSSLFTTVLSGQAPLDSDPANRVIAHNDTYRFQGDATEATLTVEYSFDSSTLTGLTSFDTYEFFSSIDAEQTALGILKFDDRQTGDTVSQEFRLTSASGGSFDWLAGAYFYNNDFTRGSLNPSEPIIVLGQHISPVPLPGTAGDESFFLGNTKTRNFSVFAQGTWQLSERFSLTGGIRWFDEEKRFSVDSRANLAVFPSLALSATVPASQSGKRDTNDIAWDLQAQYFAGEKMMTYVSVSHGVKGGGFNADWGALTLKQREFRDEDVLSYELGTKSSFFGRRLLFNAVFFHSEYDNFQNASFLGLNFIVRNAEKVITKGLEFDSTVIVNGWLKMNVAATFLGAKYNRFKAGPCYFGRTPDNPAEGTCVLDGEGLPSAPDLRFTLGGLGHWNVGGGELFARADWTWTDAVQTNTNLDPRSVQASYSILNGRIGWRNDKLDVSAWIQNATDESVALVSGPQTLFGGIDGGLQFFLNNPRLYGITLRYHF